MQRLFRSCIFMVVLTLLSTSVMLAQPQKVQVSGKLAPGDVRVFVKDTIYEINRSYVIGGTLIIEPGTLIEFTPNGRLIDSTGGRIIADGFAEAIYTANPLLTNGSNLNPIATAGSNANPGRGPLPPYAGYTDLAYFLHGVPNNISSGTISTVDFSGTTPELTVNASKRNFIFNVVLDTTTRKMRDLAVNANGTPQAYVNMATTPNAPRAGIDVVVSYEQALMFITSRMNLNPNSDPNLKQFPYKRIGNKTPSVVKNKIVFRGQPFNNFSREWGHIVILPGARAAFFRNCDFEGFKKDTTVDKDPYFVENGANYAWAASAPNWNNVNNEFRKLTTGSGGVITTFSTRTWILNSNFANNRARFKGGAIQFLQAPAGLPVRSDIATLNALKNNLNNGNTSNGIYPFAKNPNVTNPDGSTSDINNYNPGNFIPPNGPLGGVPAIDRIDENGAYPEPLIDRDRMAWDDARIAIYLGRVRNNTFENNEVVLANVGTIQIGNQTVVTDLDEASYPYGSGYGNNAFGGAIYIAGREFDENRRMEIGFGINNSINVDANGNGIYEANERISLGDDSFSAINNRVENRQKSGQSVGSKGGAIYVGDYTSLIVAGYFNSNEAFSPYFVDYNSGFSPGEYAQGGAIFTKNTFGRLQVRGGPNRENFSNSTEFSENKAGNGGAIYVDGNSDRTMSPIIGGNDNLISQRDLGYNILFQNNTALTHGGAIFGKRNARIYGAGGVENNQLLGYGGKFSVRFWANEAGYSGGALHLDIPEGSGLQEWHKHILIRRASFRDNVVGKSITGDTRLDIRGGGAIYAKIANLNVVQATEFINNTVYNGNGAAIAQVSPTVSIGAGVSSNKMFVTDLDNVSYDANGVGQMYTSNNDVFTWNSTINYPADTRMLTRFIQNEIILDQDVIDSEMGRGTTQQEGGTYKTTNLLSAIDMFNDSWGFAVGALGTIVKIDENGTKWTNLNSGTQRRINDIDIINANLAVAVGDAGEILKTTNGGATWVLKANAFTRNINAVQFLGVNTGYAVGEDGGFLMTNNGGETWTVSTIQAGVELSDVNFVSTMVGYAVGDNSTILKTIDGGATWSFQTSTINQNVNSVAFTSATNGFVVGNSGVFAKTTDGGANWNEISPRFTTNNLNKVVAASQSVIYAIGNGATVYKSDDIGISWSNLTSTAKNSNDLYGASFRNSDLGYIVGNNGFVEFTTNGNELTEAKPADQAKSDVVRTHKGTTLAENGVGLGGAIYILDDVSQANVGRQDSIQFNRVRIQNNEAFTGAGIYSDNYDLKLVFNRSLVTGNIANSGIGANQNLITGPIQRDGNGAIENNNASSDLTGAVLYGEVQGPLPSRMFSEAANSMYDNNARFLIRLPDAPDTKGVLAGTTGLGFGGTDTLRGNYWGKTEANINIDLENLIVNNQQYNFPNASRETFFVAGDGNTWLQFMNSWQTGDDARMQGPFESYERYNYESIPLRNGIDENTSGSMSIPEKLLFSGHIYDIFDKGTDIKSADYSKRRMSPIEDFAVGVPPVLVTYNNTKASNGKVVKRWVRDPFCAEDSRYEFFDVLQQEYARNSNGGFYHPIGQAIYLESEVDYNGLVERSNHDPLVKNETVFFVINETTSDFIRINLEQVSEDAPSRELFRGRVELVPDSSNRLGNTLIRRSAEGLENYGSNLGGVTSLLDNLFRDAYKEDGATLQGRKYSNVKSQFGGVGTNIFSNRPDLPTENTGRATFFAGEKYRALPVRVNDTVRVVSRTVLWAEGINAAYDKGAEFVITSGVEKPQWTGDIVRLQTTPVIEIRPDMDPVRNPLGEMDTLIVEELFNTVWVSEDRSYPVRKGTYSNLTGYANGTDSILAITAVDSNSFYDPRAIFDMTKNQFTYLDYSWSTPSGSGVRNWLMVDSIYASESASLKDGAVGHYVFKGKPINPYVVPGGETVTVTAKSYPPNYRTLDSLKKTYGWSNDNDTLAKLIELYADYYHAQDYDELNARFLQQDTIDFAGSNNPAFTNTYAFKIFVTDSVPRFLDWGASSETLTRNYKNGDPKDTIVVYDGSVAACAPIDINGQQYLVANLTDKLRFQVDINTDDELEDMWAQKVHNWNFQYGRSSYGFINQVITGDGDVIVIDTTYYTNPDNGKIDTVLTHTRPSWMSNKYMYLYGKDGDDVNDKDLLEQDLSTYGKLNIRIPRTEAFSLLKGLPQGQDSYNRYINADTAFTIIANDGHGGKLAMTYNVKVNVAPEITTTTLPVAKEDVEYNKELIDTLKAIRIIDRNFDDEHTFELIKAGDYPNGIPKDNCFPEAGNWTLGTDYVDQTPEWLFINEQSGMLYGIPRVKDAPKLAAKVSVLVKDPNGLTAVKTFDLRVDSTNHTPMLTATPNVDCWDMGLEYSDTLIVTDIDLEREEVGFEETLTFEVLEPANGVTVTPGTYNGTTSKEQKIVVKSNNLNIPRDADGKATIKIRVTDKAGNEHVITYRIKISDETNFTCELRIENSIGAFNVLEWGTASDNGPTTGDGKDGDLVIGNLDENFCEYELPPLPVSDVFDARWTMPERNGTERTIYPSGQQFPVASFIYKAEIQPGGENGNTSPMYPIKVTWDKTCVPAQNDKDKNPDGTSWYLRDGFSNGQFFDIEMSTGKGWGNSDYTGLETVTIDGDIVTLTITNSTINSLIIFSDIYTSVETNTSLVTGINSVIPNPVSEESKVTFTVDEAANVQMVVVDMLGNTVASLVNNTYKAGTHSVNWNATTDTGLQLTNGAYRVRMVVNGQTSNYPVNIVK